MGILRLLLALSVVVGHLPARFAFFPGTGGEIAVKAFYLISGFYIALVLSSSYHSVGKFWLNRALRLFPAYWTVALLSIVYLVLDPTRDYISAWNRVLPAAHWVLGVTNVTLFGQDWVLFLGVSPTQTLEFVRRYQESALPLVNLLLLPQGWSLGVEITFYLVAPFILRRGFFFVAAVFVASLALRLGLAPYGFTGDPWSYRFFPFELALFLLGSLSFFAYDKYKERLKPLKSLGVYAVVLINVFAFGYRNIPVDPQIKSLVFFASLALLLPLLFSRTKDSRIDRFIGNLSYPVYLAHVLVLRFFYNQVYQDARSQANAALALVVTLVLSAIIHAFIEVPVDRFRAKIRWGNEPPSVIRPE